MSANRRAAQKAATRETLRQAGRACFAEKGYAATQIGDVARAAGVAHGTFYVHFASKETLADELLAAFNAETARRVGERLLGGSLQTRVQGAAEAFLGHWHEDASMVRCYAERMGAAIELEALRDGVNPPAFDLLGGALQMLAAERGVEGDFTLVTQALLAMWLRIGLQSLFNEAVSREFATQTLVALSIASIEAALGSSA